VIDVFHKLVALKSKGIKIHLHCFRYDRKEAPELEPYCETIDYYERKTGFAEQLSGLPYIVKGRRSEELLRKLLSNDYPILFEGLHSCYYLGNPLLKGRKLIYRESNIEHQYYFQLFKSEKNPRSGAFFLLESFRLYRFQKKLVNASEMLVVSEQDRDYLIKKFPGISVQYLPSFHGNDQVDSHTGKGTYAFYHGNLSVAENSLAAGFLIREVFQGLDIPLIIAGLNPPEQLLQLAKEKGVQLISNPDREEMDRLLANAHVNILITFQATGLKLKLLNTLFNGRFVLVNKAMLAGTGLEGLCEIAEDAVQMKEKLKMLFTLEFGPEAIEKRKLLLLTRYSDLVNADKLISLIFNQPETKGSFLNNQIGG